MDEFNKALGYDAMFTVEAIQVINIWISMTLNVLPLISICDKTTSDEPFCQFHSWHQECCDSELRNFIKPLRKLQDKYKCLGIVSCDLVGLHVAIDSLWPRCTIPSP
jgi:hypothetical protein